MLLPRPLRSHSFSWETWMWLCDYRLGSIPPLLQSIKDFTHFSMSPFFQTVWQTATHSGKVCSSGPIKMVGRTDRQNKETFTFNYGWVWCCLNGDIQSQWHFRLKWVQFHINQVPLCLFQLLYLTCHANSRYYSFSVSEKEHICIWSFPTFESFMM